jgi:urea transport system ATP-binding protein
MTPDLMIEGGAAALRWPSVRRRQVKGSGGPQRRVCGRVCATASPTSRRAWRCTWTTSRSASTASRRSNDLSLTINVGELRCIIGPNGAGKTTMMDCITGKTRPDSGTPALRQQHRPAAPDEPRSRRSASAASSRSPRSTSS